MKRVIFLIDGFNLYHSLIDASYDLRLHGKGTKWLNIYSLCESLLYLIGNNARIENIYYFTALAYHLVKQDPQKINNHKKYIKCLESTCIKICKGNFKEKDIIYRNNFIYLNLKRHEEKETDVAISVKILECLILDECDTIVILSGDTDIVPAIKTAKKLFPNKEIVFIFPYKRKNKEIKELVLKTFSIDKKKYVKHQFPEIVVSANGIRITKPKNW